MVFARVVLVLSALLFLTVGVAFLVAPEDMASKISIDLESNLAKGDVRAVYGGFEVGLACFLAFAAWKRAFVPLGVLAHTLVYAGLASGRIISRFVDGVPESPGYLFLAIEVLGLVAGGAALLALRGRGGSGAPE